MSKFVGFKSVAGRIAMAFLIVLPILAYALGTSTYDAVTSYRDAQMIDRQNAAANTRCGQFGQVAQQRGRGRHRSRRPYATRSAMLSIPCLPRSGGAVLDLKGPPLE